MHSDFKAARGCAAPGRIPRLCMIFGALAGLLVHTGCQHVQPWEKGALGHYTMSPDRDTLADSMTSHIHFSREATTGGDGVGGGGCGCN